ncbi:MAG: hypothetical protein EBV32_02540 [Proteobacteria bacterium]|uniref:Uncharacterized protein n=1 Tax=Candidatus Fonsibacter lacus TaxID=2576439 RepID=A0A964UY70_9PROT|nr:hypothetical protein [Candidatus Fonsibacter lacus]
MINADTARAATAISDAVLTAEQLGELPAALPDALRLLTVGLVITMRELQLYALDLELAHA